MVLSAHKFTQVEHDPGSYLGACQRDFDRNYCLRYYGCGYELIGSPIYFKVINILFPGYGGIYE